MSDEVDKITKETSQEAKDREGARQAATDQQKEAGDEPDSREASEQARKDADWDVASDHIDEGGNVTK